MSKLLITNQFTPFLSSWGVICAPSPCLHNGSSAHFVPDGWQEELTAHNIASTEVDSDEITFDEPEELQP